MRNRKRKLIGTVLVAAITAGILCGCSNKVVTVGTIDGEDGQNPSYIEIQKFELKEEEPDSGREDIKCCAVLIPEGYQESDQVPGMYLHKMAPLDASNIYYTVSEGSGEGYVSEDLTKEEYQKILSEALKSSGQSGEITVESFEEVDFEDVPAYKIRSTYEVDQNTIEQLTYLVLAENTYTITYSQAEDDELLADFEISDGQIRLIKDEPIQTAQK